MTFIKTPPGDTVIKRPDFGTSVRMRKPPATPPTQTAVEGATPTQQTITVFIDGVDSGLLPQDVTELYLGPEEGCLVRLDHNGVIPVGDGEFESGALGNCAATDVSLDGGDVIATIPACTESADITVECRGSPLTPHVVVSDGSGELGAADLSGLLPDITLIINGVTVGTISRCANEIAINVTGECTYDPVEEVCNGSGTIDVEDDQGGSYSEGFIC